MVVPRGIHGEVGAPTRAVWEDGNRLKLNHTLLKHLYNDICLNKDHSQKNGYIWFCDDFLQFQAVSYTDISEINQNSPLLQQLNIFKFVLHIQGFPISENVEGYSCPPIHGGGKI